MRMGVLGGKAVQYRPHQDQKERFDREEEARVNRKQGSALFVTTVAGSLVFLFPPYWLDAGLIGGSAYVFFQNPPSPGDQPSYDSWLLGWELCCILFSTLAALLALGTQSNSRQRRILWVGLTLELLVLGCSAPSFGTILGPEFTWYFLTFLSFILLVV